MQTDRCVTGAEELLILKPAKETNHYSEYIRAFVDEGVYFPFAADCSLPAELPENLEKIKCIMMDDETHADMQSHCPQQLREFRESGGYIYIPNLSVQVGGGIGYAGATHSVQRVICTCGLTLKHPAMLKRLIEQNEEDLVAHWRSAAADELSQYERMGHFFGDPVGYITFRACDEAAEFFDEPAFNQPVDEYISSYYHHFGQKRESTGARYLFKSSQRTGQRQIHDHLLNHYQRSKLWILDGVHLNRDLQVPEGLDPQKPPQKVIDNAWTWPENAAALGDTFGYITLLTDDSVWREKAVTHVLKAFSWMYSTDRGLIMHVGRPDGPDKRSAPWGRGVAWYLYALRGLLDDLPENHGDRPELCRLLQTVFDGLIQYQDEDGLWHNVLDADPEDSRPCASATSRFLHVFARAYTRGWITDERVPEMVDKAWRGLKTKLWDYGLVAYCIGTSYGLSRQVYLARPHHTFRCSRSEMLLNWIERERLKERLASM